MVKKHLSDLYEIQFWDMPTNFFQICKVFNIIIVPWITVLF